MERHCTELHTPKVGTSEFPIARIQSLRQTHQMRWNEYLMRQVHQTESMDNLIIQLPINKGFVAHARMVKLWIDMCCKTTIVHGPSPTLVT